MTSCGSFLLVVARLAAVAAAASASLLLVGVLVLVALHACVVGKALLRWSVARRVAVVPAAATVGLSPAELRELPCYEFVDDFRAGGADDCAVCLESFGAGDRCRLLPACGHSFHAQCVDPWLLVAPVCPLCRTSAKSTTTTTTTKHG